MIIILINYKFQFPSVLHVHVHVSLLIKLFVIVVVFELPGDIEPRFVCGIIPSIQIALETHTYYDKLNIKVRHTVMCTCTVQKTL